MSVNLLPSFFGGGQVTAGSVSSEACSLSLSQAERFAGVCSVRSGVGMASATWAVVVHPTTRHCSEAAGNGLWGVSDNRNFCNLPIYTFVLLSPSDLLLNFSYFLKDTHLALLWWTYHNNIFSSTDMSSTALSHLSKAKRCHTSLWFRASPVGEKQLPYLIARWRSCSRWQRSRGTSAVR